MEDTMTPDLTLANETSAQYESAILSFAEFRQAWKSSGNDRRGVGEAYKRLIQLAYIQYRIRSLTARDEAAAADLGHFYRLNPPGYAVREFWLGAMSLGLELQAESFYLIAWRLGLVLRKTVDGFKNFNPPGVRKVRNWLIEHAEREDRGGVMDHSFQFNMLEGACLKPEAGGPDRVHDAGLYPNAKEFILEFLSALGRAETLLHKGESANG
jgi:hypothetical protein